MERCHLPWELPRSPLDGNEEWSREQLSWVLTVQLVSGKWEAPRTTSKPHQAAALGPCCGLNVCVPQNVYVEALIPM